MIPKFIKAAYRNHQSKQLDKQLHKQVQHNAKREVWGEAFEAKAHDDMNALASATHHMDLILQNPNSDGKQFYLHGKGANRRVTDHSSSIFTRGAKVRKEKLWAGSVLKNIAAAHLKLASNGRHRELAKQLSTLLEQSENKDRLAATAPIREAVHKLNVLMAREDHLTKDPAPAPHLATVEERTLWNPAPSRNAAPLQVETPGLGEIYLPPNMGVVETAPQNKVNESSQVPDETLVELCKDRAKFLNDTFNEATNEEEKDDVRAAAEAFGRHVRDKEAGWGYEVEEVLSTGMLGDLHEDLRTAFLYGLGLIKG